MLNQGVRNEPRSTGRGDGVVGPHEPALDPEKRPPHIGDSVWDEEGADLAVAFLNERLHSVLENGEPAHTGADKDADAGLVHLQRREKLSCQGVRWSGRRILSGRRP
jgi:hypothetical protein